MTGNEALVSLLIAFAFTLWLGAGIKLVLDKLKDIEWELKKLNQLSQERMSFLFDTFVKHPELAGSQIRRRMDADGIHRAVTDYIAGMTDVFAICEYHRLK